MDTLSSSTASFKRYWLSLVFMLLLLLLGLELFLRLVVVQLPRSTPALIDRVYQADGIDVIAGDSQMYRAFVNQQQFVNLARRGNPIPAVSLVLEKYFSDKSPGQVVLQASPQLFSEPQLSRGTQRYDQYFNLSMKLVKPYVLEKGITEFISEATSWSMIRSVWQNNLPNDLLESSERWLSMTDQQRTQRVAGRVAHHTPQWQDAGAVAYQEQYRQLVQHLSERGAQLCLVRPPVNQKYLELSEPMPEYQWAELFFKKLASEYNIPLVDFQELPVAFKESSFINQDHITPAASKIYAHHVFNQCFTTPSNPRS